MTRLREPRNMGGRAIEPRPSPSAVFAEPASKTDPGAALFAGLLACDRLEVGDSVPPFILPDSSGTRWSPLDNDIAGQPLLLLFQGAGQNTAAFLRDLQPLAAREDFRRLGCNIFALMRTPSPSPAGADGMPSFPLLADPAGGTFRAYGMERSPGTAAVLLGANLKIAYIGDREAVAEAGAIIELLRHMHSDRPAMRLAGHPPVLLVPGALSGGDCQALVQLWHLLDEQHGRTGHSKVDEKCVSFLHEYGRVKQYLIEDARLQRALDFKLARRLMPEIGKAFDTRAPQREALALSCYDAADGGMLGPHRDCASQETRHRRFTLSVALNDAYQGGALRFREYGEQLYGLPVGTAIIFSAALLHEVLPITAGRRFALVTHLYGS